MATSPACRVISAGLIPQARMDRTRHTPLRPHHKPKGRRGTHVPAPARLRRRSLAPPAETLLSPEPAQSTPPLSPRIPALASPRASPRDHATSSHSPLGGATERDHRHAPENSSVAGDGPGLRQPKANSMTSPSAGGNQQQRPIGTPGGGPPRAARTERTQLQGTRPGGSAQQESRASFGSLLHQDSLARLLPHAFARDTSSGGLEDTQARNVWSLTGIDLFGGRPEAGGASADGGEVLKGLARLVQPRLGWVQQALQGMKPQSLVWNPLAKKLPSQPQKDAFLRLTSALNAPAAATAATAPAEHQTTLDLGQEARGQSQFFLKLSCLQSTVLLNVLAFGYAATGVVVKAMERSPATVPLGAAEATGASAAAMSAAGAFSAAASGCLSVTTSMDFALRFTAAAVVSGVALWATQPKRSQGGSAPRAHEPAHHQSREGGDSTGLWPAGLDLGLWMFVTYASQAVGLQSTSAHDAALILTASVVLVPLLEALEGSKLHWSVWLATVLACSGLLLLEGGTAEAATQVADVAYGAGLAAPALGPGIPSGHFWCMLGAIGSAVHVVRSEKYCASHTPLQLVTLQLGTTAALGAVWLGASVAHANTLALPTSSGCFMDACAALPLGMVLLAGPLGTGLCEWLELEALQYVKASTATLILTSSPLWASLLAYFTLGETMGVSTMIGGALILSASLQVQLLHPCKEKDGKPL